MLKNLLTVPLEHKCLEGMVEGGQWLSRDMHDQQDTEYKRLHYQKNTFPVSKKLIITAVVNTIH